MPDKQIPDILADSPDNWGKWGDDDEIGALNYLTEEEVLRGATCINEGKRFNLGIPLARPEGDPAFPNDVRQSIQHYMVVDKSHYEAGKIDSHDGSYASDDVVILPLHHGTHVDALGHGWYGDKLYNDFDPETTKGGLEKGSIQPIAEQGIVGRGVLVDIARHRGVKHVKKGDRITLDEIKNCLDEQDIEIEPRDIPLVRTGWLEIFYDEGKEEFFEGHYREPGLTYSEELVEWFHEMEIPAFGTDTLVNEQTISDTTGTVMPLHSPLLRDLGVLFIEALLLDQLAEDCFSDGQFTFMLIVSGLKFAQGTGSPVNPMAIK